MANKVVIITNDREFAESVFSNELTERELAERKREIRENVRAKKCAAKREDNAFAECEDDAPASAPCERTPKAGLCELAGLIRRARVEVLEGNIGHAVRTLGRVSDALESEINK